MKIRSLPVRAVTVPMSTAPPHRVVEGVIGTGVEFDEAAVQKYLA